MMLAEPVRFPDSLSVERTSTFAIRGFARHLDLTTINHADQNRLQTLAIYQLHGDMLIYCVAPPGQPRPRQFATDPGDNLTVVTLRRASF